MNHEKLLGELEFLEDILTCAEESPHVSGKMTQIELAKARLHNVVKPMVSEDAPEQIVIKQHSNGYSIELPFLGMKRIFGKTKQEVGESIVEEFSDLIASKLRNF